ncbi:MAG TPA: lipid-A-disaccharide synthase [Verrucomicrobiales bacterium]|nr:lipid-A-disaccharide synthase [Verrucomicrobiales bacterium]
MGGIMIIAGEASGDTLAAELIRAIRQSRLNPPLSRKNSGGQIEAKFFGAGGPKMEAAGFDLEIDLTRHAVVGIWEVIKQYSHFKKIFDRLLKLAYDRLPQAVILVDYPGFNLRFAKALKKMVRNSSGPFSNWDPKIIYYVSPQIWAWHESRIKQIAKDIDLILSIFPFEKKWYADRTSSLRVEYVGHPILDRFQSTLEDTRQNDTENDKRLFKAILLPGSRKKELNAHLPEMLGALQELKDIDSWSFNLVIPNETLLPIVTSWMNRISTPRNFSVSCGHLERNLRESDIAIASSGTVTMECAFFGVPTIVLYKTSWITYKLGRMLIKVPYLAMPNLLAEEEIYPELIQDDATPEKIHEWMLKFKNNPEQRRQIQRKLKIVITSLGQPGAAVRAAGIITDLLNPRLESRQENITHVI